MSTIRSLLDAVMVIVDDRSYSGREVVTAGLIAGIWERCERELIAGAASLERSELSKAQVDEEVRAFRSARRLLSAEEFLTWLSEHALGLEDFRAAVARALARRTAPADGQPSVDQGTLLASLPADAIVNGSLERATAWLVDRVIAVELYGDQVQPPEPKEVERWQRREQDLLVAAAFDDRPGEQEQRLEELLTADLAHRRECADTATETALRDTLGQHSLDWVSIEIDTMQLPHDGAAAEAATLLLEGSPITRVAELASAAISRETVSLEALPAALQGTLSGARAGQTVRADAAAEHAVWQVVARRRPSLDDAETRERTVEELLARHWRQRRAGRVQWRDRD